MILQAKVLIVIDRDGFNLMGINQMENPLANQQLLREKLVHLLFTEISVVRPVPLSTEKNL